MALTLMKGSEAIAEAAIRAGARFFFGYPITPQTEIPEYMSARMPEVGGCFLQAESEVAAINMVYGAAGTGARVITSSSSPGVSLKQEGISYCAGAQLPCVILNVMRGGPGLGNIQASQGDYFQGVKGGGNGDYHLLTYAPSSVQEAIDIMMFAFDKAEKYRMPVLFLADGIIAQMMEPVEMPEMVDYKVDPEKKPWACTGWKPGDDPANILCADEAEENPDIARVREVIDTKCNERQQNLFFAHFGEGKQLEEIRKEEVAASGKEKKLQAVLNVKNDVIGKVADAFGVTPVKRRRTKKG